MNSNYPETTDNFTEFEETISLTDKEIFSKIWTSPKIVFKFINDNLYNKHITPLLLAAGISNAMDRAVMKNAGDSMSLVGVILLSAVIGGLFGWISYYIYGALLSWTGKWLDGKGNTDAIVRMLAYAAIPSIAALVLLVPKVLIYGNGVFQSESNFLGSGTILNLVFYTCVIAESALGIWTIVLSIIGLSVVQKFSIVKSVLNFFLPIIIIAIPIFILVFLFLN